jgi:hypothetical protein
VKFRIAPHAGFVSSSTRPANAVDLLWQRLGSGRDEASFARLGPDEIGAAWGDDALAVRGDERSEIARRAVLEIVRDVCERAPELELDWFAVGFFDSR